MQMRLLNLARSTDRLALFHARNPHMTGIVRAAAIDGRTVDRDGLAAHGVVLPTLDYTDGALGNALSHLRLWRDAVEAGEAVTVVEDDAVLCANFDAEVRRVLASLQQDWDYVAWGYGFDAPITLHLGPSLSHGTAVFSQKGLPTRLTGFSEESVRTQAMKLLRGFGTLAYSVSPRGAERLINFCLPLRPLVTEHPGLSDRVKNRRIDNMMAHAWPSMSAFAAIPPLAVSENDAETSTVRERGGQDGRELPDGFPLVAFAAVARALGGGDGVAIGLRATHGSALATAGLRGAGWGGFDIAVDPAKLGEALRDRGVEPGFDLLYVGPGCLTQEALAATLEPFRPRAAIVSPERSLLAHATCWQPGRSGTVAVERPAFAAFAEAQGYAVRRCPEAPDHAVLLRRDVDPQGFDRFSDGATGSAADRKEAVRLWH